MKKHLVSGFICAFAFGALAATIDELKVRQQWPWSTDVTVEYRISGVTSPVNILVSVYDGETELDSSNLDNAITGKRYGISESGVGSLVIDPVKAFGKGKTALLDFKVELEIEELTDADSARLNDEIYRIYCLTNGGCVSVTRGDLLNRKYGSVETDFARIGEGFETPLQDVIIWTGVTNNIDYKTTHLVMRKIPAAGVTWLSGDGEGVLKGRLDLLNRRHVKLTQDYFIGVFELTQDQYTRIYGSNSSTNTYELAPLHPAENFARYVIHGNHNPDGNKGVITGEVIMWPTNSYLHDVGYNTVLDKLRKKTKVEFDLPTAAQWEFACRAGTTGPLYSGKAHSAAAVKELGWCSLNSEGGTHVVGGKLPNAFGLYDMLGNVSEFVHDQGYPYNGGTGSGESAEDPMINPVGMSDPARVMSGGLNRIERGGSCVITDGYWQDLRAGSACIYYGWTWKDYFLGARIVCPVEAQWGEHP